MSKTHKLHTHKAHSDKRSDFQNKSRKTNFRMRIKSILKKSTDYEEITLPLEKEIITKKTSTGYISPIDTEASLIKQVLARKKAVMNGYPANVWWLFHRLDKILINAAKQKDSSHKACSSSEKIDKTYYLQRSFQILSEEELVECVHKYFASKGGKT